MKNSVRLKYLELQERSQTEDKLWIMKNSPCQHTYFGTLVENVRETQKYKDIVDSMFGFKEDE